MIAGSQATQTQSNTFDLNWKRMKMRISPRDIFACVHNMALSTESCSLCFFFWCANYIQAHETPMFKHAARKKPVRHYSTRRKAGVMLVSQYWRFLPSSSTACKCVRIDNYRRPIRTHKPNTPAKWWMGGSSVRHFAHSLAELAAAGATHQRTDIKHQQTNRSL